MTTIVPADGVILDRVREALLLISSEGLSRQAYSKFDTALLKTAWARHHQRRFALVDGADVLASATRYDLAAVLDQRPVRVCGIGEIFTQLPRAGATAAAPATTEMAFTAAPLQLEGQPHCGIRAGRMPLR